LLIDRKTDNADVAALFVSMEDISFSIFLLC